MKLFWKLFFTTMLVTALCVSLSGGLLIGLTFRQGLLTQADTAREHGSILSLSMAEVLESRTGSLPDRLAEGARSLTLRGAGQQIPFALMDAHGRSLYSTLDPDPENSLAALLDAGTGGWRLQQTGTGWQLQSLSPAVFSGELYYLETARDVTGLFEELEGQCLLLVRVMTAMLLPAGLISWLVSRRVTRPLLALAEQARALADLPEAEPVTGDEVSLLSRHFSRMSVRLSQQMEALREEARRKERFVAAFSHELKTPMTSIIGYADLLRRREMEPDQRRLCAEYIFSEGKRLEALSMALLDLTLVRSRAPETELIPVPALLDELLEPLAAPFSAAGIRLTWQAEPGLIRADPVLPGAALRNLADNGRKAMEAGGTLWVTGQQTPEGYRLTVRDTGRGMPPEELERITEAFYTVDRARSRQQGGAGLGLALVQEILDKHGFQLSFESALGAGTAAYILIPGEVQP